jgi:D-lactate dehydrogenase
MESEKAMLEALSTILPEDRIKARLIDRHSFARDASFYRLIPKVVVQPVNEKEIIELFSYSQRSKIPLVFRAAGTSLSGQSLMGFLWRSAGSGRISSSIRNREPFSWNQA